MQKGNWILGKKGCISRHHGNWFVVLSASIFIAGASVHSAELNPGIDTCTILERHERMQASKPLLHTHNFALSAFGGLSHISTASSSLPSSFFVLCPPGNQVSLPSPFPPPLERPSQPREAKGEEEENGGQKHEQRIPKFADKPTISHTYPIFKYLTKICAL